MVSALIIVLLRNEIKLLWRNHETQQGKNNGSKFYYRAFLSHTDSFTLSYPYLFTWNVTLYKILLWLKVRRRPNYNLSIAAHATHRNAVSQAFGSNWKQNSWVDVGLPKFTCATFNGVGRIGTFLNCTHFNNFISQKLVSYLFWLSWHSLLRNGERVAFFSHQFYWLVCDLVFSSSFKIKYSNFVLTASRLQ